VKALAKERVLALFYFYFSYSDDPFFGCCAMKSQINSEA
jgi:hypothetical protein